MRFCSQLRPDVAFTVIRISERPYIQSKWFNARIKCIKRLCMTLVLALMGHILNKTFKMKYQTHAYRIDFEMKNVLKR